MSTFYFCKKEEADEGKFLIRIINNISIGCLKNNNEYHFFLNVCPHAGAPICKGTVSKITSIDNVCLLSVRCPWHGWHYKIDDGQPVLKSIHKKLIKIQYQIQNDEIFVLL